MPKPDFLCIGAPRSGTTFLHRILKSHPAVLLPETDMDKFGKEMHFFNDRIRTKELSWYEHSFAAERPTQRSCKGEFTPQYVTIPQYHIKHIEQYLGPRSKIILVLRHPVTRITSDINMKKTRYNKIKPDSYQITLFDVCLFSNNEYKIRRSNINRIKKNWERAFSPERVLTISYDSLVNGTEVTLESICHFLEISQIRTQEHRLHVHSSEYRLDLTSDAHKYLKWKWRHQIDFYEKYFDLPPSRSASSNLQMRIVKYYIIDLFALPLRLYTLFRCSARDVITWVHISKKLRKQGENHRATTLN